MDCRLPYIVKIAVLFPLAFGYQSATAEVKLVDGNLIPSEAMGTIPISLMSRSSYVSEFGSVESFGDQEATRHTRGTSVFSALLVAFDLNKGSVTAGHFDYLDVIAELLKTEPLSLVVEGHTDASGSWRYNQMLSERRALSVVQYFISVHGIEKSRLIAVGKGKTELLDASNSDSAVNRRVELKFLNTVDFKEVK